MLAREFRMTLSQFGTVMAFLAVMPLVYMFDSSVYRTGVSLAEYVIGGYGLLWFIAAIYLGYNAFRPEMRDGSLEYLLSLPIGRLDLMIWKTLPRILILYLAAELGSLFGVEFFTGRELLLSFIVFTESCGFILGLVGRGSWKARCILFLLVLFTFIINSTVPVRYSLVGSIAGSSCIALELVVLLVLLLPVYAIWDLRPVPVREKRLSLCAVGPLLVMAIPVIDVFSGR